MDRSNVGKRAPDLHRKLHKVDGTMPTYLLIHLKYVVYSMLDDF